MDSDWWVPQSIIYPPAFPIRSSVGVIIMEDIYVCILNVTQTKYNELGTIWMGTSWLGMTWLIQP